MRMIDAKSAEKQAKEQFADKPVILGWFLRLIRSIPTIDAVEVVRCKDCKHCWYDEMFGDRWCNGNRVHADSFCSDGERRGEL